MRMRIVVGAQDSPEGQDAVALGAMLAATGGGALTLLRALGPPTAAERPHDREMRLARAERDLHDAARRHAPDARIEISEDADPARALCEYAERSDADMVVIGSSRRAADGRCAIARTGRSLLKTLPAAIAIAARGLRGQPPRLTRIAVGYDGGTESRRALQLADALAVAADAELYIETIYEQPIPALVLGEPSTPEVVQELRENERRGAISVASRAVTRTSPRVRLHVRVGEPGREIRHASERADLTVIGSRRWGPCARVLLGGAGETLASDCGSSLIVTSRAPRPLSAPAPDAANAGTGESEPHQHQSEAHQYQ